MSRPRLVAWKLTHRSATLASHRYRCFTPARHLQALGVRSRFYSGTDTIDWSERPDALVFVKSFTSHDLSLAREAARRGVPVLLDLCDNLFDAPPRRSDRPGDALTTREAFLAMAGIARAITTTGPELAARIESERLGKPVLVVPDPLETPEDVAHAQSVSRAQRRDWVWGHGPGWIFRGVLPRAARAIARKASVAPSEYAERISRNVRAWISPPKTPPPALAEEAFRADVPRLVWFGHAGIPDLFGMTDLLLIKDELAALAREREFLLVILSNDKRLYEERIAPLPFPTAYEDWRIDAFEERLARCHVTLIPNPRNRFTLGKSANRAILSLSRGVPVVATRTPALEPLEGCLALDAWGDGTRAYLDDPEIGKRHVSAAKERISRLYTGEVVAKQWSSVLAAGAFNR